MNFFRIVSVVTFLGFLPALAQRVSLEREHYDVGEDIKVDFSSGPGSATDWIGVYAPGNIPDGSPGATVWNYTNGTQTGSGNTTEGTVTFSAGSLVAGEYAVWFLANDGYEVLAGPVRVMVSREVPPVSWVVSEFRKRHAVSEAAYSGRISAYASDPGFIFSKVSGPGWLTVSEAGELGGTPGAGDVGLGEFLVRANDGENERDATLKIEVCGAGAEVVRELKVMSYNAWHGWGQMTNGHRKGIESIILADADIIGMQESTDNVSGQGGYQPQKVAEALGWYYRAGLSGSLGVISRYPIIGEVLTAGSAQGARIIVAERPTREVVLMNCHLDPRRYGPYAAQLEGATAATVLAEELASQRDEEITALMDGMVSLLENADEVPVILTGDFNAPSHLDWTPEAASSHDGVHGVAWPTSKRVVGDGMKDSFREVNPHPELQGGVTWSPIFKGGEAQDRIDFVYYKGGDVTPVASEVFVMEVEVTLGPESGQTDAIRNNTWPSDHAAVVTTFRLHSVDEDEDGLCDAFEMSNFGSLMAEIGAGDADRDGSSNEVEEFFATDPGNGDSRPGMSLVFDGSWKVMWDFSTRAYFGKLVCEESRDLVGWQEVWNLRDDPLLDSGMLQADMIGAGQWRGKMAVTKGRRLSFYRLRYDLSEL